MFLKRIACFIICILIFSTSLNAAALSDSAKAAILINGDTGEVIFEKNADASLSMASTTKIMTGLLLCEYGNFDREITVTGEMLRVEGSSMGLLAGDKVTLHDLLYGLMLASGNDAANVIAFVLGGTVNGFVKQMNEKAVALGLSNTHFATPSGLDSDDHYTTARDLARLALFAMKNEEFKKAVSSKSAVLNYGNPPYRRTLTNHNKLLKTYEDCVGIKTGFTKKSGRCLVSAVKRDGKFVIAVTLSDPNDWQDHKQMLDFGLEKIKSVEIKTQKDDYEIPIINGENETVSVNIKPYSLSVVDDKDLSNTVNLPKFLYAPIKEGEKIGSVTYKKGEEIIEEVNLYAEKEIKQINIEESFFEKILCNFKYIFYGIWEK